MEASKARFTDPPAPAAATAEQPVRIKGGILFLGTQVAIFITLLGIAFRAGGLERQVEINTGEIQQINEALKPLSAIAAALVEGRQVDQDAIRDIRERIRALEGKR